MKLAGLHDGKMIGFPDDAEDDHMDAAIKAYHVAAGKAEPPQDPGFAVLHQGLQMVMQYAQQLAQQISQTMDSVAQLAQQAHGLSDQLAEMRQHDEHANKQVVAALTAPKKIVHDKDGRPVGVTVGN